MPSKEVGRGCDSQAGRREGVSGDIQALPDGNSWTQMLGGVVVGTTSRQMEGRLLSQFSYY